MKPAAVARKRTRSRAHEFDLAFLSQADEPTSLDRYIGEIRKESLLNSAEEYQLGVRAQQGDEEAVEILVRANLRFVISIAKKYQNCGIPMADLIQEGNAGLVTAARRFDPDQGVKFISYAVWWIRQAILIAVSTQGRAVRIPQNRANELQKYRKARERLKKILRREPTLCEIAEAASLSVPVAEIAAKLNQSELRLDAPLDDDEGASLVERFFHDAVTHEDLSYEAKTLCNSVLAALESLSERETKILRLYYGIGEDDTRSLEQIGEMMGITRERVRQIRDRALKRLKEGEWGAVLESLVHD